MAFQYNQLAPVLFGDGAINLLGEKVKELGCKKVICVYDSGVLAAGIAPKAEASLKAAGIEYVVYDKISADPADTLVDECAEVARQAKVDGFVAIGGGSSMDCSKAAAVMYDRPGKVLDYLTNPPSMYEASVPVIHVPTTSGTGSEVTQVAVISDHRDGSKPSLFMLSKLAIVDPELTYTVPPTVTANTGLDAFTHAAESITALGRNPRSELLAKTALEKIKAYLPTAVKDGKNKEARYELSLAANWAGIAFADTNCHLGHNLADGISCTFHTPHGYNCIMVNPELMKRCATVVPREVKVVGEAIGVEFTGTETNEEIGQKTADGVRALMRECGIKSPKEMGMDREKFIDSYKMAMEMDLGLRLNCPFEATAEIVKDIYEKTYDNYQ